MNVGTVSPSDCTPRSAFTLADLAACCLPIVVLAASIASLL